MDKLKLLAIGDQAAVNLATQGYPGSDVTHQKTYKIRSREKYDVIIAYHVLQLLKNKEVIPYLERLHSILNHKGVLNLFVPALEWLAEEIILEENPSPICWLHLNGYQNDKNDTHLSAFTLRRLRNDLDLAGFAVTHATRGFYTMQFPGEDGKPIAYNAGEHILIAYRRADYEELKG